MGIAYIILGIVGALGIFSIWQNSRKNTIIKNTIKKYLESNNGTLIDIKKPQISGPFGDKYYDKKQQNLYENIGYQAKETIYRKVSYEVDGQTKTIWLQLRIENMQAVYTSWQEAD